MTVRDFQFQKMMAIWHTRHWTEKQDSWQGWSYNASSRWSKRRIRTQPPDSEWTRWLKKKSLQLNRVAADLRLSEWERWSVNHFKMWSKRKNKGLDNVATLNHESHDEKQVVAVA